MDYQALALGEAASVVTAVTLSQDTETISISCLYDPQTTQMPYTLLFQLCTELSWNAFEDVSDPHHLDAELIGFSLQTKDAQPLAIITTDMFELSFFYENFCLLRSKSPLHASHT